MTEVDRLTLLPATELDVVVYKLPSGEHVVQFQDCTGTSPVIYKWCLDMANEWLNSKPFLL